MSTGSHDPVLGNDRLPEKWPAKDGPIIVVMKKGTPSYCKCPWCGEMGISPIAIPHPAECRVGDSLVFQEIFYQNWCRINGFSDAAKEA